MQRVKSVFESAVLQGKLFFASNTVYVIEDHCIDVIVYLKLMQFQVRLLPTTPKPYDNSIMTEKVKTNPFLPYDPSLFVTEFDNHNLILNKYSIVKHHLLLTTKGTINDSWYLSQSINHKLSLRNSWTLKLHSKYLTIPPLAITLPFIMVGHFQVPGNLMKENLSKSTTSTFPIYSNQCGRRNTNRFDNKEA